jgi:predicted transcriptional regulator
MSGRKFTFTTKADFQLFLLMRLIRTNRPKVIILQIMGISVSDYDELIKKAVEKGLIDDKDNALTQTGIKEYEEIMKKINSYQYKLNKCKKTINKSNNNIYIPITFRGKT